MLFRAINQKSFNLQSLLWSVFLIVKRLFNSQIWQELEEHVVLSLEEDYDKFVCVKWILSGAGLKLSKRRGYKKMKIRQDK